MPYALKLRVMKSLINIFLLTATLAGQYPADSLFQDSNNNIFQKMFLYPIAKWQRVSYNSEKISCQFHPNCSLYGARAIHSKGAVAGSIITYDRIVRCNESALFNHNAMGGSFHSDGRLIDPLDPSLMQNDKSPVFAATISAVLPGSGRAYGGRMIMDGIYGFMFWAMTISLAEKSIKRQSALSPIFVGMAAIVHVGEIYGAYRTAKYYQPPLKSSDLKSKPE